MTFSSVFCRLRDVEAVTLADLSFVSRGLRGFFSFVSVTMGLPSGPSSRFFLCLLGFSATPSAVTSVDVWLFSPCAEVLSAWDEIGT